MMSNIDLIDDNVDDVPEFFEYDQVPAKTSALETLNNLMPGQSQTIVNAVIGTVCLVVLGITAVTLLMWVTGKIIPGDAIPDDLEKFLTIAFSFLTGTLVSVRAKKDEKSGDV